MVKTGFTANDPKGKIWIDCKTIERDYPELTKQFEDFKKLTADTQSVQYEATEILLQAKKLTIDCLGKKFKAKYDETIKELVTNKIACNSLPAIPPTRQPDPECSGSFLKWGD